MYQITFTMIYFVMIPIYSTYVYTVYLYRYYLVLIDTDIGLADSIPAKKIFPMIPSEKNDILNQKKFSTKNCDD